MAMRGVGRRIEVGADATLPEILKQLQQGLPPFTEIRLFQGKQELVDEIGQAAMLRMDESGQAAKDRAHHEGHDDIVQLLEDFGRM